jgi:cell division protein FtsL
VATDRILVVGALLMVLLISALAVIYSKYYSRLIFIEIQKQERALDQYEVEWGQLQLELTTLTEQNRVELVAREQLKLVMPLREKNYLYKTVNDRFSRRKESKSASRGFFRQKEIRHDFHDELHGDIGWARGRFTGIE